MFIRIITDDFFLYNSIVWFEKKIRQRRKSIPL